MNHRNTLNTRLLPLSILISSLVSGGAMAASGAAPTFNESDYTAVTSGNKVLDQSKWSDKFKAEYQEIKQKIDDLTKSQTKAEEQLAKGEEYALHEKTVTDLASAPTKKDETIQAVTAGASSVKSSTTKLDTTTKANETALIGAITDMADKTTVQDLIAEVRAKQNEYHTALTAAKTAITNDPDAVVSSAPELSSLEAKKEAFEQAVSALESAKVDSGKVLGTDYKAELEGFYTELDFEANKVNLETAYSEISTFKDLLVKKETAAADFGKFTTANTYINTPDNAANKLTVEAEEAAKKVVADATSQITTYKTEQDTLTPTEGTQNITKGQIARNEVVDTNDQTIETGGASVDIHVIDKTQTVQKDAIAKNSTITGVNGKQVLEVGAQSIGTVVNDGAVLENNGGTDYNSVINQGGKLQLAGTNKDNLAQSFNAQILEGGTATVEKFAEIHNLSSTKGTVTLKDGAKAHKTTITGGTLTIEGGANAQDTTLIDTTLDLVENATADSTTVGANSTFTLGNKTTTGGTILDGDNSQFIVGGGASASLSFVHNGIMTVKSKGSATNTVLSGEDGAELILESGAEADGTEVYGRGHTFTIQSGAEAVNTQLHFAELNLVDGAKADGTKLFDGSTFTLQSKAETKDTFVHNGVFDVQKDATANNTTVNDGTFTLAGTANDTIVNGGVFDVQQGATANTVNVNGGKFNLMERAQAAKLIVENGYALIAGELKDATFHGGTAIFDKTATISGNINAVENSVITVHDGAKTQDADLNLAGNMQLVGANAPQNALHRAAVSNPAQFAFKNVALDGGTVDMSSTNAQLTMASLSGAGTFNLAASLYNQANAPLNVTGDANGSFGIQLSDNGVAPTNLQLIDVQGNNAARFSLSNGPINLGNYKHNLVSDGKGGYKLVADTAALTPSTAGVLAVANTMPVIFNAELSSIQNRLDKQSTSANESGVWINYLNNNFKVKGTAANFDQKLNGVTLGGDKAIEVGDSVLSIGGFAARSSSDIKSDYQSSGSVESNSLGAYAQYLTNGGYYLNGVLKTNQFKQKLNITSNGSSANGSANFSGLGVALKAGKHINVDAMYVSPYAALSTFTSGKSQYQLSNGMDAQNQGSRNTTGTLGVNTGYRFVLNSGAEIKPYALFSVDHDLMARNNVLVNGEMFDNSRKGTRVNAGVGMNVNMTKNLSIGSEVKLSKGKNVDTPVTINLGVGYTF
ncbi:autotransporter protein [Yersinia bercovieri]|uniref:autotransporter outer membrane beta-barrel domain-containing protein n=1 Tax=Yersinia bercovieri TaxID=634 RepID=UPI00061CB22A|nr:autotransporter outer membrane beta-barrel domain-containing protein [Yersinia bercovieri]MCB5302662.1 autotransporter outer membrane beta-barrel domain-containing protein [Yersinia bercovieri]CNE79587.1 autotransporter protein [Yersinia bercovieri]